MIDWFLLNISFYLYSQYESTGKYLSMDSHTCRSVLGILVWLITVYTAYIFTNPELLLLSFLEKSTRRLFIPYAGIFCGWRGSGSLYVCVVLEFYLSRNVADPSAEEDCCRADGLVPESGTGDANWNNCMVGMWRYMWLYGFDVLWRGRIRLLINDDAGGLHAVRLCCWWPTECKLWRN
jgi:hypothetical protein